MNKQDSELNSLQDFFDKINKTDLAVYDLITQFPSILQKDISDILDRHLVSVKKSISKLATLKLITAKRVARENVYLTRELTNATTLEHPSNTPILSTGKNQDIYLYLDELKKLHYIVYLSVRYRWATTPEQVSSISKKPINTINKIIDDLEDLRMLDVIRDAFPPEPPTIRSLKKRKKEGFVYLIEARFPGTGYKIGRTRNIENRRRFFGVKLPFDWELIHCFGCDNASKAEKFFHIRYGKRRINGEWFDLSVDEVNEIKSISGYNNATFETTANR